MNCPTSQNETPSRLPWLIPTALAALTLLAYANTFYAPFIFDDGDSILENPSIRNLWNLREVLFPSGLTGGMTAAGRPVASLSVAINHAVSGYDVWSYHAFNLLVHVCAGLVLFGLVRRTLCRMGDRLAAAATPFATVVSALWLLHPLQTESVTYIIQRAESLAGLFYLLTLYCFVRAFEGRAGSPSQPKTPNGGLGETALPDNRWLVLSVLYCLLGMASKEVMVSAPLAVFLYDRTFVSGSFRAAWQARKRYYMLLASTWIILALLILHTGGRSGSVVFGEGGVTPWSYLLTQCKAIAHYLWLCAWPARLVLDYGVNAATSWTQVWMQGVFLLLLLGLALRGLARTTAFGFLGFCFFATLAPSSSIIPIATQTMAEHRMYLALAPVLIVLAAVVFKYAGRRALVGLGAVALIAGYATHVRNHDYRSGTAIWADAMKKLPKNPRAQNNYALCVFAEQNNLDAAIAACEEAVRLDPKYRDAYYNLGVFLSKKGSYAEAASCYRMALSLTNDINPEAHTNLGNALFHLNQTAEAMQHYLKAIEQNPGLAEPYNNYANALLRNRQPQEAIEYLKKAVAINPAYAEAQCNWGNALAQQGRMEEAIAHFKECLRIQPNYTPALNNLGSALLELNRLPEAGEAFAAALRIKPDMLDARQSLAYVYARTGRIAEALANYRELLCAKPDDQGLRDEITRLEGLLKQ